MPDMLRMRQTRWTLSFLVCLTTHGTLGQLQAASFSGTAPVLSWSVASRSASNPDTAKVFYKETPAATLLPGLLGAALGTTQSEQSHTETVAASTDLLFLFAGPQVEAAQLAQDAGLEQLRTLQQQGSRSLSYPYVEYLMEDAAAVLEAAYEAQGLDKPLHKLGACPGAEQSAELRLPMVQGRQQTQIVLVCGPQQDKGASMQLLGDVAALAESSGRSYSFLYAGHPQVANEDRHGRALLAAEHGRLLSTYPPGDLCNKKCRSQVQILQNWILAVTLLSSLAIGMCFLHLVGTPTRFEMPKEASRQD